MRDREVVKAFVSFLKDHGHPCLRVDRWPEDDNRQSREIDAIAGRFAIEHTSIDSVANQRRDDDWYSRVVGGLDREITSSVDSGFVVTLRYDAVRKGQDWAGIRADLRSWISTNASGLSYGTHDIELPTNPPLDPPIRLRITKTKNGPVGFARFAPCDQTLPARIKKLLDEKAAKLATYHMSGVTTVLLVENGDIALMNDWKMLEAMRSAYPDGMPHGVDQIWYADTSISNEPRFVDFTPRI